MASTAFAGGREVRVPFLVVEEAMRSLRQLSRCGAGQYFTTKFGIDCIFPISNLRLRSEPGRAARPRDRSRQSQSPRVCGRSVTPAVSVAPSSAVITRSAMIGPGVE